MTDKPPTVDNLEDDIFQLRNLSHLTMAQIERHLSIADPSSLTGNKDFYYLSKETIGSILYGVYRLDADLRDLVEEFGEYQAADFHAPRVHPVLRQGQPGIEWADAIAKQAQALDYRQQEVIYQLVDKLEDIVLGIPTPPHHAGVRTVANEISEALRYVREAIGIAAENAVPPADEQQRIDRAALLLRWLGSDPSTNAQDITDLVAPFMTKPVDQSITAEAA